eukprot:scaffold65212_cov31-Tisochrysis_lutea.AAC.2
MGLNSRYAATPEERSASTMGPPQRISCGVMSMLNREPRGMSSSGGAESAGRMDQSLVQLSSSVG